MPTAKTNDEDSQPWGRRPRETSVAHKAMLIYLRQENRSHAAVSTALGKAVSLIEGWSAKWAWVARSIEYDSHEASVAQAARDRVRAERAAAWEKRRIDDAESAYQLGTQLHIRASAMLDYPLTLKEVTQRDATGRETAVTIKPASWTLATANAMARTSVEIRMLACDVALADVDSFDPASRTPEECQRFMADWHNRQKARRDSRSLGNASD